MHEIGLFGGTSTESDHVMLQELQEHILQKLCFLVLGVRLGPNEAKSNNHFRQKFHQGTRTTSQGA